MSLARPICYLVEGSRLWIVVMKMSTMKAHTRLDLKTSSLIWEYCSVSVGGGGGERREGGRETV